MDKVRVRTVAVSPIITTAPIGSGCKMSPIIVDMKMANRCHASGSISVGWGENQIVTPTIPRIAKRRMRLVGLVEFTRCCLKFGFLEILSELNARRNNLTLVDTCFAVDKMRFKKPVVFKYS